MSQAEKRNGQKRLNTPSTEDEPESEQARPRHGAAEWSENEMPRQQRRAGAAMPAQESVKECVPHDRPAEKMVFSRKTVIFAC